MGLHRKTSENLIRGETMKGDKLKSLLWNSHISMPENKEKVIFYLTAFPYFTESISSLIFRYIDSNKVCVLVFPIVEEIISRGIGIVNNMVKLVEKMKTAGAVCCTVGAKEIYTNRYKICFLCSEYSGRLPEMIRKNSRYVVALQTTALYIHMYQLKERFEEVFSEEARNETDYLVTSEYMADWICERNERWKEKILSFGYPRMDALYYALKEELEIPEQWKSQIAGKKVYLFTTWNMEQAWLDYFKNNSDVVAIWRPHPQTISDYEEYKRVKEIESHYNILIDDMPTYEVSFKISDALIAALHGSIMVNYLYTGKPVCIYGGIKSLQSMVIDYREELWYKCAQATFDPEAVLEFIRETERGRTIHGKEQLMYRRYITNGFDGQVCQRIYNYFEEGINR
ncbi:MAG: hypothetical protein HFH76_01215 [Lachnospiraceae bacterium]|nr:hypothetical protein [Lachnospiraceae bacterium]